MKRGMQVLVALVLTVAIIGSVGCRAASPPQEKPTQTPSTKPPETVTLRYTSSPGSLSLYRLATELGYAQEEGIEFKYVGGGAISGGPAQMQAIAAGSIDVSSSSNPASVINAIKAGFKLKLVVVGSTTKTYDEWGQPAWGQALMVWEDSGINGPRDLVGKRIGVNILGALYDYTIRSWLRSANIPREQVELVVIPSTNMVQVFQQRQVDGVFVGATEFWAKREALEASGVRVRVFPVQELLGDVVTGGIAVSEDLIKKNPDAVRRFVRAYVKTWDWEMQNLGEWRKFGERVAREEGGNPDLAKYYLTDGREHALLTDEDIQFWINELVLDGKLKEGEVKPSDIYTNEFNPYYGKK